MSKCSEVERLRDLRDAVEVFLCAYRAKFKKSSTEGVRSNAPFKGEFLSLAVVFNDIQAPDYAAPQAPPQRFGDGTKEETGE